HVLPCELCIAYLIGIHMGLCNFLSMDAFSHRTTLLPETIYFCIKYSIRHQILPSCKRCISIREKIKGPQEPDKFS
ncbi:MAG: hypothetical protein ACLRL6_05955, partial [Clostridium sp.]